MTNMDFAWLVFAHLVGDFVLQDEFQAKLKGKRLYILLVHSALWAGAVSLCLLALGILVPWKMLFLLAGHAVCDWLKARLPEDRAKWWHLYPDQAFHGIQLLVVWLA